MPQATMNRKLIPTKTNQFFLDNSHSATSFSRVVYIPRIRTPAPVLIINNIKSKKNGIVAVDNGAVHFPVFSSYFFYEISTK